MHSSYRHTNCLTIPSSLIAVCLVLLLASPLSAQKNKKSIASPAPAGLIIADNENTRYRIVLPSAASEHETKASLVLQEHILQISGAALPIIAADDHRSPYEIVLGQNERIVQAGLSVNLNELQEDGFIIVTDSSRLFIAGGSEKGTLYGVYTFLEKYLGCRMYAPNVKVVPKQKRIVVDKIKDLQVPAFRFRDTHYRSTWQNEYIDWHKLDHDDKGGRPEWGMWVHTFNTLVPPEIYYEDHPEYFALVKGNRLPTQLCLTNRAVLDLTVQNLRQLIAQNPDAKYWSVSQNDNKDFCTCDNCKAIDEREGSPSGSIINFVNQVADQFPDKVISTLAYEYGRHAPRTLKPRDNVNIMLCSIEAFRHKPITEDTASADFVKDVEDWGKVAKDIIVWDYVIQFNNLISPFPNLHVLQPNLQFFAKHNVNSMFEQGNREVGGEFAALRGYLLSKLMWDPNQNVDTLMNDFLRGMYGPAAGPVRRYIDEMREALLKSGKPLRIFGTPNEAIDSYLTPSHIARYEELFNEAEKLVADSALLLERVRIARQPLEFAILEQAKKIHHGERGVFVTDDKQWKVDPKIRAKVDPFVDLLIREGVTQVKEWSTTPDDYRAAMYRLFSQGMNEHLAYGKKVSFVSPEPSTLKSGAELMLTDGKRGSHDYDYNWMTFQGKNLEVVIDLEQVKQVKMVESAYYQYGFWLRLLPAKVEYFTSVDGKNFTLAGTVANTLPIDQYGGQQRDFIATFAPRDARYIKVVAHTIGNTPSWHPGAGRPAVMLVDEIVVE